MMQVRAIRFGRGALRRLVVLFLLFFVGAACAPKTDVPVPSEGTVDDPDLAAGIELAAAGVRSAPGDANAWAALGMTYDANGFPVLAESCYRKALALRPEEWKWWYHLAFVLEREDRFDDAAHALFRADTLQPGYPPLHYSATIWALARGRLDEAEVAAGRTMETSHGAPGALLALGRVQLERGRDAEAAQTLARAVAMWTPELGDPAYPRFLLGTALSRIGRAAEAAPLLANGVVAPSPLPDPWRDEVEARREGLTARLYVARKLAEANRLSESIALLEGLRRRHPDNVPVATDLGSVYMLAFRTEEALALLRSTAAAHPDAAAPKAQLVKSLWAAGQTEAALLEADAAVATHPESVETLDARGTVLLMAGRAEAALTDFEAVARLAPDNARVRASAGVAQLRLGRYSPAQIAFEEALRRDSGQANALAGMALVALARGDVAGADAWLAKIARLPPQGAELVAEARARRAEAK